MLRLGVIRLKRIAFLALLISLIFVSVCSAKMIDIKESAEYSVGDGETKAAATEKVIAIARRRAIERAGVYVQSYSKTDMGVLTNDEIEVVSATVMKDKEKPVVVISLSPSGSILLTANVFITINTDDINRYINESKDRKLKKDIGDTSQKETEEKYNKLQKHYEDVLKKLELMQQKLDEMKKDDDNHTQTANESISASDENYKKLEEEYKNSKNQLKILQEKRNMELKEKKDRDPINEPNKQTKDKIEKGNYNNSAIISYGTDVKTPEAKAESFVFKKYIDPNTSNFLTRDQWCFYYEIFDIDISRGRNHENAGVGGHKGKLCWNWVPVELGGNGQVHIRISQDKKYFEIYTTDHTATITKVKIKKGVLNVNKSSK